MAETPEIIDWHQRLSQLFENNIKGQWAPLVSKSPYARGDTFERLLGKERDNAALPDFGDIEIKASDARGGSMISLFTKSPSQTDKLREKYGIVAHDAEGVPYKRLSTTFGTKDFTNSKKNVYDFKIEADRVARKLKVVVRNKEHEIVSDGEVFWSFDELENSVVKKLSRVAVVDYDLDEADGNAIRYNQFTLTEGFTFDRFLQAVDDGALQVDFRLGQYRSGSKKGQLHDHGTAFRMSPANFRRYGSGQAAVANRDDYVPHAVAARTRVTAKAVATEVLAKLEVAAAKITPARPSPATLAAQLHRRAPVASGERGVGICWGCGRPLSDPKSIARGYGPGCAPAAA